MRIRILPSLLAADQGALAKDVSRAFRSGADAIHLDVMDAHFVPNLSFGPAVVEMCRQVEPGFYRHVHLMMTRPDLYIEKFVSAGAQTLQVHVEADCDPRDVLVRIRELGARAALAVNPETPISRVEPYLDECDELLVMTVHPGYGGQTFIGDCLPKIEAARAMRPDIDIMVDGGINGKTAVEAVRAGANLLVAGSYLFALPDMARGVAEMRAACEAARAR
jgi:ribulose-phosphate 3-epimerase